jgi:hypothetical protein
LNPTSVIFEEDVFAEGACKAEFLAAHRFSGYTLRSHERPLDPARSRE